MIKMLFRIFRD